MQPNTYGKMSALGIVAILSVSLGICLVHARPLQYVHTKSSSSQFVQVQGGRFVLNSAPFVIAGANNYYAAYTDAVSMDDLFATAAQNGINVMRCWAYSAADDTGVPAAMQWTNNAMVLNDAAFVQLDAMVASAASHGIRLVMVLSNNWNAYRGTDQINAWAGNTYHDQYFTNPTTIAWYQSYAQALLTRRNSITGALYSSDSTIFAWELMNEPRCKGDVLPASPQCSTSTLTAWVEQQAAFIKSLDSNHLLAVGDEGFFAWPGTTDWTYDGSQGVSFDAFINVANIDYGTFHLYPNSWSKNDAWAVQYIQDHIKQASAANKPVVMEEYGFNDPSQRQALYREWTQPMCSSGGSMLWMLGARIDGTYYQYGDEFMVLDDKNLYNTAVLQQIDSC